MSKLIALAVAVAGAVVAAAPANAVVTTFAQFQALGNTSNIRWVNSGSTATNGTGGSLFTIATPASTVAASRAVSFSFLQPSISPFVTNVNADFTLSASAPSGSPALLAGFLIQPGIAGSFSFVTTAPIVVGTNFFATGSNLLSGTFSGTDIIGQRGGTSGSFGGSTSGGSTISFTSDFLSFAPGSAADFSLSLTSIFSALQAVPTNGTPNRALRSFRANATGQFSSDPAPVVTAVPEPAVWGLMIVGFGMVGLQTRRRDRQATVAA